MTEPVQIWTRDKRSPIEPPVGEITEQPASWQPTIQLARGVRGFAFRDGERIMIPLIIAENEGSGDVGRFLDRLSDRCVVMTVTSERLRSMLQRRRYVSEVVGEEECWRRR